MGKTHKSHKQQADTNTRANTTSLSALTVLGLIAFHKSADVVIIQAHKIKSE